MSTPIVLSNTPLVGKYFGRYLNRLISAQNDSPYEGRFYLAASYPTLFEERLRDLEPLGLVKPILKELAVHEEAGDFDSRLMDAWAEIRTLSQLVRDGFDRISKVVAYADFTANHGEQPYAFQVKRITGLLKKVTSNPSNEEESVDTYGKTVTEIHAQLDDRVAQFFWQSLMKKNGKFRRWAKEGWIRCIVLVTGDEDLQDSMVRHIACQQLRRSIHRLRQIYFEELLWLPDLGNGAWFEIGEDLHQTHCFADWKDTPGDPGFENVRGVYRREVDIDSLYPGWINPERIVQIHHADRE
jgi:hypothetical protein